MDDDTQPLTDDSDFDFNSTAITKNEYTAVLDSISDLDFVNELTHSPSLDEIHIALTADTDSINTSDLPNGVSIKHISPWDYDDTNDNRLGAELRTTRLFLSPEEESEYFPGKYAEGAMAFLAAELSLFREVDRTPGLQLNSEEYVIRAVFGTKVNSTTLFDDLMSFFGYSINKALISNGYLTEVWFEFDETREWGGESLINSFQEQEEHQYQAGITDYVDDRHGDIPIRETEYKTVQSVLGGTKYEFELFPVESRPDY